MTFSFLDVRCNIKTQVFYQRQACGFNGGFRHNCGSPFAFEGFMKYVDATHTQNLAKSNPPTTPAPWTVQWHLKALKSARGLRRNWISPRSYIQKSWSRTHLRPNRPWRSPRVKIKSQNCQIQVIGGGRCRHVDSVENLRMRSICVQIKILRFLGLTHIYARRAI